MHYALHNCKDFINSDPIQIPHRYKQRTDIEVSGFLTALISWGRRDMIIKSAGDLMQRMDNAPYSFLMEAKPKDFEKLKAFKYRTLNGRDLIFILHALKKMYRSSNSLEEYFLKGMVGQTEELGAGIHFFRNEMLKVSHEKRSEKHISTPVRNSACKKICMFLRWMVRKDAEGVDFGLWTKISPSALCLPLDVHAGATARKIGLLKRKQNDWKAVLEITEALRDFDDKDPVRFDYALFGMGIRKSQTQ